MKLKISLLLVTTALLLSALATPAQAHERFTVDDRYNFVIGWANEPAVVDAPNGVEIKIVDQQAEPESADDHAAEGGHGPAGAPVEGAEETVSLEVSIGGKNRTFELDPRWGEPGWYDAQFVPTVPGQYTFRLFGTLDGEAFEKVIEYKTPIEGTEASRWPEATPSSYEMQQTIENLQGKVANLEATLASLEEQNAAQNENGAPGIGILAAVGTLGVVALVAARRQR